jgi:electron transfer flavoprotein alpha subunit
MPPSGVWRPEAGARIACVTATPALGRLACEEIERGAPDAGHWSALCKLVAGDLVDLPIVRVVDRVVTESSGPSIEEARVIVTGGRGVGGPDGFVALRELAGLLGGAVRATRAAVDADLGGLFRPDRADW